MFLLLGVWTVHLVLYKQLAMFPCITQLLLKHVQVQSLLSALTYPIVTSKALNKQAACLSTRVV